jgi:hypothetical protein
VVFAGGGGLELLIQPDSIAAATKRLDKIFIMGSTGVALAASIVEQRRALRPWALRAFGYGDNGTRVVRNTPTRHAFSAWPHAGA